MQPQTPSVCVCTLSTYVVSACAAILNTSPTIRINLVSESTGAFVTFDNTHCKPKRLYLFKSLWEYFVIRDILVLLAVVCQH